MKVAKRTEVFHRRWGKEGGLSPLHHPSVVQLAPPLHCFRVCFAGEGRVVVVQW
jgi:hypothetical protein